MCAVIKIGLSDLTKFKTPVRKGSKIILKNTTKNPDRFLRRMIAWCCRELRMPVRYVHRATFGNRTGGRWRGTSRWSVFTVRIGDMVVYPTHSRYTQYRDAVKFESNDYFELLVNITAHELAHIRANQRRASGAATNESSIDALSYHVLKAFRADRENLLAAWGATKPAAETPTEKPVTGVVERRAEKARADLLRWERKLKAARNKVQKYRARVQYYEKRQTAAVGGAQ